MLVEETHKDNPLVVYYDEVFSAAQEEGFSRDEQKVLEHINDRVADTDSLEDIAEFLLSADLHITPTDRLCFAFLEEGGLRALSRVVRARYTPVLLKEGYSADIRSGSLPRVIEKGYPRVITDLEAYAHIHPESDSSALLAEEGVRSGMTCPLTADGRMVGLLFRNSRTPGAYGLREVMLHLAVARRISQTVGKACRIMELEEANRNYSEMLSFVSHELKSPIGTMVMDSNLMLQGYLGELKDAQKKKLKTMVDRGEYLLGMIEDYLNLGRIENAGLKADIRPGVDFREAVLNPAISITAADAEAKNIRIETDIPDNLLPVACDPKLMNIVMVNLLSNAIKYGFDGGLVRISAEQTEEELRLRVYNTGPGFPDSAKGSLFRKFSRIQTKELMSRKGTGVGLYTVWRILRLHGGAVTADSEEGSWAEFSFSIPGGPA